MDHAHFSDPNSLPAYGFFCDQDDVHWKKDREPKGYDKFKSNGNANDNDGDKDDDLPSTVLFALLIVGMWTPTPSPCTDKSSSLDEDYLRPPLIDKDNDSDQAPSVQDLKNIDFISLNSESPKPNRRSKRLWRTVIVEIATLLYLMVLTSTLLIDGGAYLYAFWGKSSELLYMISYITLVLQILIVPIYSLFIRLSVLIPGLDAIHRCPLKIDFVRRRVRRLCASDNRMPLKPHFMVLFMGWPLLHVVLRAITWLVIDHKCHVNYFIFSDITAAWGFFVYGLFWYLIYIERVSLHEHLKCSVREVKRASLTQNVDAARHEINHVHRDYFVVRELMAITMVTASWGVMSHLSWDYAISGEDDIIMDRSGMVGRYYLDVTIWSEKVMFVFFPCLALAGINLEYMWQRFRHVLQTLATARHRTFWHAIHLHTNYINNIGSPELKWTLVFVFIGPYLSLQSRIDTEQNLGIWNGPFHANCSYNSAYFFPVR